MSWRRAPSRSMPVSINRATGKITQTVAIQNDPAPWSLWLRRGGLCEATENLIAAGEEVAGLPRLYPTGLFGNEATIKKGELVTFLGRLVVDGKYTENYKFLCARGVVFASPSCFKDARGDENGT